MDDLISRQAAIDTLKAMALPLYKDPGCEDIYERDRTLDNAIDAMRRLPSAQTEPIKLHVDLALTEEEIKNLKQKIADSPIVLMPSAQPESTK